MAAVESRDTNSQGCLTLKWVAPEFRRGLSCGLWQRFVLWVWLVVLADAVHEVVQVAGGELPAERPGGLVVPVDEAQQGPGQLFEAVEVVGRNDFFLDDGEEDLD